ncbi:MAG: PorT family protein [Saprospiraceae bacterium]|nr:PorT family protein [Saprospiraceae bacterium]
MKNYLIILLLVTLVIPLKAQQDTLANEEEREGETIIINEHSGRAKRIKSFRTRWGIIDFGISGMISDQTYRLENGIDPFEQRLIKSTNLNIHILQSRLSLARGHLNLAYGLTLETHKYFFDNPVVMIADLPEVTFEFVEGVNFKKNRLNYTYLTVPLMLNIKSNPKYPYRSLHLSAGVYGGFLLGANFKTKTKGEKDKVKDNFGLNDWRYGLRAEVGYGPLIFYGSVALNELFEEDKNNGYKITPYSVGIILWPF